MSELVRCFVAVETSPSARAQLGDLLRQLGRTPGPVRWGKPDQMHLTLAFLGEVPQAFVDSATQRLGPAAARFRRFEARLGGLGAFPDAKRARIVWVGVGQGRDELCALQAGVVAALRTVGFRPESRPFSPHLTIGRVKIPADLGPALQARFESETFTVGRVVLFRSVLQPAGPIYSVLSEFPLSA
jgi:RNA 2',3'-cyclic 3'-phosphodiesterase